LVPIGDRPLLAHQVDRLHALLAEATIVVNAHHQAPQIVEYLSSYDPKAQVIVESTLLGTAGGVRGAANLLGYVPMLVVNVDIISVANYLNLLKIVETAAVALSIAPRPMGQGTVGVDEQGHVVRIRGETFGIEARGGNYTGVMAIGADVTKRLPECGCLVGDFIMPLLHSGVRIQTLDEQSPWIDVGDMASYARANFDWLKKNAIEHWTSPTATVDDRVQLRETIVGQEARIDGSGLLRRAIIWPKAHLDTPCSDVIVTRPGVVVPIPRQQTTS
jgi:mannose-1-phosphate guanylyltransferase